MSELSFAPIYGNSIVRSNALHLLQNGAHHTFMFSGPQGLGKATYAGQLACLLLGGADYQRGQIAIDPDHATTRQMLNLSHPDYLCINSPKYGKKSLQIPTQALEDIHAFTQRQGDAKRRILIIDALDDCHPTLAQGLLKLLEEPPAKVTFLLINHAQGQVLDTIRSRSQIIKFTPLKPIEMQSCLPTLELGENPPEEGILLMLAEGIPARAILVANADLAGLIDKLILHLRQDHQNSPATREMLDYICHKKYDHLPAWKIFQGYFVRQLLREKVTGQVNAEISAMESLLRLFRDVPITTTMLDTLQQTQEWMEKIQQPPAYLDPEQTVHHVLCAWHNLLHHEREIRRHA